MSQKEARSGKSPGQAEAEETRLPLQWGHRATGQIIPPLFHRNGKQVKTFRRLQENGGQELGAGRGAEVGGDGNGRSQDRVHLSPVCDSRRGDAERGGKEVGKV